MLKNLHIQNYALIEDSEVDFPGGLTVITGETGAGKSILLGALNLILGGRADASVLNNKQKKCIIEAVFNIKNYALHNFFEENELDYADETILRRELSADGKSRAFINDSPVNLGLAKKLGELLIDVHSQHETLFLKESSFQFEVLDAYAEIISDVDAFKKNYLDLKKQEKELAVLIEKENQAKKDADYFTFQLTELEEANIQPGELSKIENESSKLENAELIKSNLLQAANLISLGDTTLLSQLAQTKSLLGQIAKYDSNLEDLFKRISSLSIELKELGADIEQAEEKIGFNPTRLEDLNSKIDKINRLLKKHNLKTEDDLILLKTDLEKRAQEIGSLEQEIKTLSKQIADKKNTLSKKATELSKKRKSKIPALEKEIAALLNKLAMPNALFKVDVQTTETLGPNGFDELKFLFTANKGVDFKELHKVASGGELSRLMLCIKYLIAKLTALPAIIFDEIDTGISGDVAAKMGTILESMAEQMQVISITHLPQIASKGQHHLFVYKQDVANKTLSNIKVLSKTDRVTEIAKMLSTDKPTTAALNNAKELLGV